MIKTALCACKWVSVAWDKIQSAASYSIWMKLKSTLPGKAATPPAQFHCDTEPEHAQGKIRNLGDGKATSLNYNYSSITKQRAN